MIGRKRHQAVGASSVVDKFHFEICCGMDMHNGADVPPNQSHFGMVGGECNYIQVLKHGMSIQSG